MSVWVSAARRSRARAMSWVGAVASFALLPAISFAAPIDLNALFHADGAPIAIAADGSSAIFSEDPSIGDVFLSDIPVLGDPELLVASAGARLLFDYDFNNAPGNSNTFQFAILNGLTGDSIDPFSLFRSDSASGTVSFDLSSLIGLTLGFQFDFGTNPDDVGTDATLTISNLRIETPDQSVPEPRVLLLMAGGLLGLAVVQRRRRISSLV